MASNMYHCVSCEFSSEKQSNYIKHLATLKHKALIELTQFSEAGEAGTSSSTSENAARSDEKQVFTEDFFPFSNRLELLLYVLRGSKYHCIDQELFKFILLIIRVVVEDNIKTVPPFHKIWNLKVDGLELKQSVSSNNGKDVSFIKPSDIIEMQLSKKLTAVQLQRFPRCGHVFEGQSSGSKWRTEIKSLMALNSVSERIYVGDRVKNGINGESGSIIHFFCQEFEDTEKIYASVKCDSTRTITVRADGLMKLDESNVYEGNDFERVKNLVQMSKQLDMDIYTVPVNIFVDDTSGNRSKKWNPLQVWTLQLAGLPTDEKMKKSTHHFIGVTQPEDDSFITPVVDDLNDLFYDGKVMYDAAKNKDVIVTSQIAVGLMDNSMASEFCHHMGAAAKENCRFCRFGNNHLNIRDTRTKEKTEDILKEIETSINGKETSTRYGIKKKAIAEEMNKAACWDPHRDIPPDMLHCIYLGEVSILLKCMLSRCTDLQKENLQLALNAANWKGFHHKCGEKFIKYHKSSQGKDFRSFVQHAPFTVHHAGFSTEIVKLWCLLSEIVQLSNKLAMQESELSRLGDLQYQFNQLIYQQFPDTLKKQKIHHCLHTEEQIRLHGVPIGYTTETGESWCGIVKHLQSITNHHNANRDTAMKLAHIEEICHIIDNGTWKSNGIRVQPGKQTVDEINHPRVQSFVMGNKIQKENEQSIGVKRLELGNRTVDNRIKLNSGDIVYFRLNEHISYGLIHQITSSNVTVVMMKELGEDAVFKCLKLGLTTTRQTLLHTLIEGTLFVAHDCKNGGCCVMVTENSTRKFRHNMEHQIYFVNRFKIHFNFKGILLEFCKDK